MSPLSPREFMAIPAEMLAAPLTDAGGRDDLTRPRRGSARELSGSRQHCLSSGRTGIVRPVRDGRRRPPEIRVDANP